MQTNRRLPRICDKPSCVENLVSDKTVGGSDVGQPDGKEVVGKGVLYPRVGQRCGGAMGGRKGRG